jgi:hypothetical protein
MERSDIFLVELKDREHEVLTVIALCVEKS